MILFLLFMTGITFWGALKIENCNDEHKKIFILLCGTIMCVGILFVLKYLNFFVYTGKRILNILGQECTWAAFNIIAPLGISFFTLQMLGYLIDVQRGVYRAEKNVIQYVLFSTYFPQLTSGPINRYNDLGIQFKNTRRFVYSEVAYGMQRMMWGFFKKLVISERMAVIVNEVYADFLTYSGFYIVIATVCFAIQLYTDFSGYMDIVLGISQALGIQMAENFRTPFFSRSISEYWRRWHITLGAWFKDYVFYPVLKSDSFIRLGNWSKKKFGKKQGKKSQLI